MLANPRRRRRRRHSRGTNWSTAWLGNRHRRRHHRRHRRNPEGFGVMTPVKHPGDVLIGGTVGAAAAFMAIALPNWLLPFPGVTLMDRVLRLASRAAAGGLVYTGVRKFAPRYAQAALACVTAAVGGGFILDTMGITLAIGRGDTALQPGQLVPTTFDIGFGAYGRGGFGGIAGPAYGQLAGYQRGGFSGFRGLYGGGTFEPTGMGANLYT